MDSLLSIGSGWRQPLAVGILFILLVWESAFPFFGFFRARGRQRIHHGVRNIVLGLINSMAVAMLFIHLWGKVTQWSTDHQFGLLQSIPVVPWQHLIGALILLDLWTYWWHRFNHEIPFLWRFHKVHHSDPYMDVTTANRFHLGEIILSSILRLAILPLIGATLAELALYETLMFANTQVHHANLGLKESYDRLVRLFVTSPAMHKVHHSDWLPETNSNYTAFFSVWDRMFGSFRLSSDPNAIRYGLKETNRPEQQTFIGILRMPAEKPKARRERTPD